ncbi:MAG TPA: accessory Sec system translocase SecA2, partial [Candidatus Melainabacteria bacterium]|nr:accessory Sec system translocase SecA2 [Candidatus Melainabacteria bacterium]
MEFVARIRERFLRLRSGAIELSNRRYEKVVKQIRSHGSRFSNLPDEELRKKCGDQKQHISRNGVKRNEAEYFALVGEVANRILGMKPYDVQMLAALALSQGRMVEMQTGEGKTLAAVAPACLHAIAGRGSHILTFNDYLAKRDAQWMKPIYEYMGFRLGYIQQGMAAEERSAAYACDITYVTAKEVGFDYLRDQLCSDVCQQSQRGFYFAIIDEADSTVVDEARIPLVIAGEDSQELDNLQRFAEQVRLLTPEIHFSIQQGLRNANFEAAGLELLQLNLGCGDLFDEANVDLLTRLNLALQAELLLTKDVDYIVRDGRIELVDEFTGRVAENRRWPYGLQAAIEAKENVEVQPQGRILKSITLQHFLDQYQLLSGMTGTARSAAIEIFEFFDLKTVVIPPNKPCIRIDQDDLVFLNRSDKLRAIVEEITKQHSNGRPVLVGTSSVEESEKLSQELHLSQINCTVLNAKNDQAEAAIVAHAGIPGAVTISTNMAGRGTDIVLGGPNGSKRQRVVELGGLYVIGTNRHESRRIDDQLRGRAGRQGDPGETRFFVSAEDELISRCGVAQLDINLSEFDEGKSIEDPVVGKRIARIQQYVEAESLEIRRTLRMYTKCTEVHRRQMKEQRQQFVIGNGVKSILQQEAPELFDSMTQQFGLELARSAEKTVAIYHIDDCWADHLHACAEIRNNIHLTSFGGFNAVDEFNKRV